MTARDDLGGAKALFRRALRVSRERGRLLPSRWAPVAMATVHPLSLLRAPDAATRQRETERFIADLRKVAETLATP